MPSTSSLGAGLWKELCQKLEIPHLVCLTLKIRGWDQYSATTSPFPIFCSFRKFLQYCLCLETMWTALILGNVFVLGVKYPFVSKTLYLFCIFFVNNSAVVILVLINFLFQFTICPYCSSIIGRSGGKGSRLFVSL